ncbi:sigma-54-dependent Fis family transcriptional regulator [Denitromonas iodatirespirans]|uniref:Sigma 54-interacting transcriptional regulator n=1 Tax=Denitromonas iodatirespirans TaxID=2795389 RepID=A0A944DCI9_DENI1|nr:sigma-54-dependent Fis family transcriptional regulator [Denitromonas iodatirespirans]MBT0962952.1 sigma 54-interacting transcriptional regulator [Denitromonas iodatirespirans]
MSRRRVSLAEVTRAREGQLSAGDGKAVRDDAGPTLQDLTECLFFSPGDGRIWLDDQRMVLVHNTSLGALRRELIERLGHERARGLLTRAGYVSGVQDAQLVRERWVDADPAAIFVAGTRLHSLEGVVKVEVVKLEFDPPRGTYNGEFLWHHSSEDDQHIAAYGVGTEPACWMQLGYAMGYVTTLLGKLTIFREVECRSMGHEVCRVLGRTADQWGDVSEDLRYLNAEGFAGVAHDSAAQIEAAVLPVAGSELPPLADRRLVGVSSAFNAAAQMLRRVAPTRATVLFVGESGVGKELFAQMLHTISPRTESPFISINCAAIPENLVESELFGVERGAFTGAVSSRPGRFERADGGTLFLDEIGCLSLTSQGKLLRALQESVVERVGGTRSTRVNVRVVAATNEDLRKAVAEGRFREDLFYRLNVFPVKLPPLRERREDIPLLLNHFLRHYNEMHERQVRGFTPRVVRTLLNYRFPGNVRELQNLVERGVIVAEDGGVIDLPHILRDEETTRDLLYSVDRQGALAGESPLADGDAEVLLERFRQFAPTGGDGPSLDALEAQLVRAAVERADGNVSAAARLLGLTRSRLAYRIKKLEEVQAKD